MRCFLHVHKNRFTSMHPQVRTLLADPSTTEHVVVQRAVTRMRNVVSGMLVQPEQAASILDMSRQVSLWEGNSELGGMRVLGMEVARMRG